MQKLTTAALLLAVAAPGHAAAQGVPDSGTFTLIQGDAVIATERFERTDDRLETSLELTNQATMVTRSTLHADATVSRIEVEVYGPGGVDGNLIQSSAATFENETVVLEQPIGEAVGDEAQPADAGALPYVNPSPSYMEQIVRRARVTGGQEVRVPLWIPGQPQASATVTFGDGAATISLGGVVIEAETDDRGRLLGATIPSQGITIDRD